MFRSFFTYARSFNWSRSNCWLQCSTPVLRENLGNIWRNRTCNWKARCVWALNGERKWALSHRSEDLLVVIPQTSNKPTNLWEQIAIFRQARETFLGSLSRLDRRDGGVGGSRLNAVGSIVSPGLNSPPHKHHCHCRIPSANSPAVCQPGRRLCVCVRVYIFVCVRQR